MPGKEQNGSTGSTNDSVIQGGAISGLDQDLPWRAEKHHAQTASKLAFILVWVLVISFVAHYIAIGILSWKGKSDSVELLSSLFGIWLPVISGFVGGAVTYYFTKERKQ